MLVYAIPLGRRILYYYLKLSTLYVVKCLLFHVLIVLYYFFPVHSPVINLIFDFCHFVLQYIFFCIFMNILRTISEERSSGDVLCPSSQKGFLPYKYSVFNPYIYVFNWGSTLFFKGVDCFLKRTYLNPTLLFRR